MCPNSWNIGDTLTYDPSYMQRFNTWNVYDQNGDLIRWGAVLNVSVPLGRYMCQLTATDTSNNISAPSAPVWLYLEKSPFAFQPRGLTIIIKKYNPNQ